MLLRDKLKELRTAAGLTQPALAEAAGVPLPTLRKLEQGQRTRISLAAAAALGKALGTDCGAFAACDDIAAGEDPEPPAKKLRTKKK